MADRLTQRERDVLSLIANGLACTSIAAHLCISEQTVRKHRRHLLGKMGASNAAALCTLANLRADTSPKPFLPYIYLPRSPVSPQEN
ncbi:helix-turn-helix domain-containing protein [Paraburkholderia caribensis]|uniref:response regulator transcription factor n=1 Tax=Paraburkholderia caribensis TaxID=75105 RepID=UPI0009EB7A25